MSDAAAVTAAVRAVAQARAAHPVPVRFVRDAVEALGRSGVLALTLPAGAGGHGGGLREAAAVVERVAAVCASTATVLQAHYAAVAVLDRHGPAAVREQIAAGRHLASVALTEPGGTADLLGSGTAAPHAHGQVVDLTGCKSWVPAAGEADSYLWSGGAFAGSASSLWLVPANAPGLHVPAGSDAAGLRGAAAAPVTADPVRVPVDNLLGGGGLVDELVLPWFVVLGAAVSMGIVNGTVRTVAAETAGRPDAQAVVAELRVRADSLRAVLDDTIAATASGRPETVTMLLALRAVASGAAVTVTELAAGMLAGRRARTAARAEVERSMRDATAARAAPPAPRSGMDRIVRGLWLAARCPDASPELVAAGATP